MTDQELVALARAGDDRAFASLIEPLRAPTMYRLRRMLRDPMTVEDVFQESCWKAYRGLGGFDGQQSTFAAWFYRICTNRGITEIRNNKSRARVMASPDEVPDIGDPKLGTERLAMGRLISQSIDDALNRINPKLREAFILRELEGMSIKQIATLTGAIPGVVRVRLHRARAALAVHLTGLAA